MTPKRTVKVEVINDFEKVLDVPYYSQFTEIETAGLEDVWQRRSCGILCLKMVIDYWHEIAATPAPDLRTLIEAAEELGALNKQHDWTHDGLVRTAEHFGFISWRRKWVFSAAERRLFTSWGWSTQGVRYASDQTAREGIMTLTNAIVADVPVIISVPKEFNVVPKSHIVVVTGIKKDALLGIYRGFYVNDPYNPARGRSARPERKDEFIEQDRFIKNWNKRAIFLVPKSHKPNV